MCGRISFTLSKEDLIQELRQRYDIDTDELDYDLPRYNIAPTENILSIVNDGKNYRIGKIKWGFIPSWAKDDKFIAINAKAETIDSKPMFKDSFKKKRCIILADGFYEWKKDGNNKIPYRITSNDSILALAGLWSTSIKADGSKQFTCTIITTTPNELMTNIHDRMPVILDKEAEKIWLSPSITDLDSLKSILTPFPADKMKAYQVSTIVNSPRNDSPQCIEPISI